MIYKNYKNQWCRKCPTCNNELIHIGSNGKANAKFYDKLNKECRSCCREGDKCCRFGEKLLEETKEKIGKSNLGKKRTEEHKRKYSECQKGDKAFWYGKTHSDDTKQKMSNVHKGIQFSKETKQKLSIQKMGKNNPMYGKKPAEEHRERMRISALNRIKEQGIMVAFNPNACQFIDDFGKKHGYNFQHAQNGGEVLLSGFPVDGYDKEKNIIFEYDEPYHYNNKRQEKDKYKQECIVNKIKPKMFIRYDEKNNRLYDALADKDLLHNNP